MRALAIAFALISLLLRHDIASGFEIEDNKRFSVANEQRTLSILSSTDLSYFEPLIQQYQQQHPNTSVDYTVASSTELFKAVKIERAPYDLVISSAMDLQMKLVNDGYGVSYQSDATGRLPAWARWRDLLFAVSQEPSVLLASSRALADLPLPSNRQELITLLRQHPERFKGKIGTYDVRVSGAGYLFATQDARRSDVYWRLAEVMGSLSPKLYCCSSDMIRDLESGQILLAYNVVGSYASQGLGEHSIREIVPLLDFTHLMLRTAMIPQSGNNPALAGQFIDFLVSGSASIPEQRSDAILRPAESGQLGSTAHLQPIRLGPGLLVYLDKIKRNRFLDQWTDAMVQ